MEEEFIYRAQKKQDEFHSSPAKFRLYGGSAGGGKSEAILFEAIALCNEIRGAHGLVLRRTFPELKMSLIIRALEKLPKGMYKYSHNDHLLTWLPTGSRIQFGYCQKDEDVFRYQGAEFDFIGMDEMTQFTEFQFKYLLSRLRTSKPGVQAKFFGATNPGGVGHEFVKRLWIEHRFTNEEKLAGFTESSFEFIRSSVYDNKYLGADYVANLRSLPEAERRKLLDGDWDVYEGRFFEDFNASVHVIDRFDPPDTWKRFRAIDFGRTAPFACLWLTLDQDGSVYVYREYYEKGKEVDDNSDNLIKLSYEEAYSYTVIDSAVFAKTGFGETIGERIRRKGIDIIPAHKSRLDGWVALKQYMSFGTEKQTHPKLYIMNTCRNLIEEIKNAQYSDTDPEDLSSKCSDHALDALRYFIMTLRDKKSKEPTKDNAPMTNPKLKKILDSKKVKFGFNSPSNFYLK